MEGGGATHKETSKTCHAPAGFDIVLRRIEDALAAVGAGIVDHEIELSQFALDAREQRLDLAFVGRIALIGVDLRADLVGNFRQGE